MMFFNCFFIKNLLRVRCRLQGSIILRRRFIAPLAFFKARLGIIYVFAPVGISPIARFAFAVAYKAQLSYVAVLLPRSLFLKLAWALFMFLLLWVFRRLLASHSLSLTRLNYPTSPFYCPARFF